MLTKPPTSPQPKQAHDTMNFFPKIKVTPKKTPTTANPQSVIRIKRLVTFSNLPKRGFRGTSALSLSLCEGMRDLSTTELRTIAKAANLSGNDNSMPAFLPTLIK
jgi:hypothetical protein